MGGWGDGQGTEPPSQHHNITPSPDSPSLFPALWSRVEELELWNSPEWFTLGHYHRTMWLRIESRIDDPRFFLHPRGKTDRRAELKATLRAFTEPDPALESGERPLSCRFPARRRWLLEALELPEEAFASPDCAAYHQALEQLQLSGAAVVYPAAYLNNPASMFGHLLIVLDREDKSRLLSRAVNYGAEVNTRFGPLYAVKGIFGLYEGMFTVMPYAKKVEEYNAVNRRDIWEYPLDLNADEFDRLTRHVWELQELRSRYFFFKENCAFNLLYPIEAARPEIGLTRRFRMSAIPVNLLKELTESGVTGEPVYRPSKATVMAHLAEQLSPEERTRALQLSRGGTDPAKEESALVLSFAIELVLHAYTEESITPAEYRERVFPIMSARGQRGRVVLPEPPAPAPPHAAHDPRRLHAYGGRGAGGAGVAGLRARAAYHAWLDVPTGYAPGSYITFFEADIRASEDFERLSLRQLTLVEIRSLAPATLWANPLSWAVSFRVEEDPFEPEHHQGLATFATGRAWNLGPARLGYLKLENTLVFDQTLDHTLAWEPGAQWGAIHEGERLRAGVRGSHRFGVWGSSTNRHRAEAEVRWALTPAWSVGALLSREHEKGMDVRERFLNVSFTF